MSRTSADPNRNRTQIPDGAMRDVDRVSQSDPGAPVSGSSPVDPLSTFDAMCGDPDDIELARQGLSRGVLALRGGWSDLRSG